ncbi:MAG: hypothetical protein JW910_12540, partial [Anaerolineae bacterium]|nr:hypothetical protein [Anaerolineae bacterium]
GWAQEAGAEAEVTIVFTYDAIDNPDQQALLAVLPPERTVVVALRSPYDWTVYPYAVAYLTTYTFLPPTVPAVCAALFGARPLTGVLPVNLSPYLPAGTSVQRP